MGKSCSIDKALKGTAVTRWEQPAAWRKGREQASQEVGVGGPTVPSFRALRQPTDDSSQEPLHEATLPSPSSGWQSWERGLGPLPPSPAGALFSPSHPVWRDRTIWETAQRGRDGPSRPGHSSFADTAPAASLCRVPGHLPLHPELLPLRRLLPDS